MSEFRIDRTSEMKKALLLVAVFFALGLTSACESERSVFGEEKKAPDEFAVYSRAPLSLPPDFGLRPPKPGADRPQVVAPRNDARKALLGNSTPPPAPKAGDENVSPGMMLRSTQLTAWTTRPPPTGKRLLRFRIFRTGWVMRLSSRPVALRACQRNGKEQSGPQPPQY